MRLSRKRSRLQYGVSPIKKIMFVVFLLIIGYVLFLGYKVLKFYHATYTPKNSQGSASITKPPEEKKIFNFLVMGYGGAGHDGAYLTDTLMVAHVDMNKKKALLVSIPHDVWAKIPTKSGTDFHEKINAVYQMGLFKDNYPDIPDKYGSDQGAADLLKEVLAGVTGLKTDNYIAIDFQGFRKAVDLLGGVDVNVEKTFDDYEYPVDGKEKDLCGKQESDLPDLEKIATESPTLAFPCRYEHLHFDKGMTHMDGTTALKYVRSRHSLQDGTDFGRAARQQRFLEAVKDKVISFGFITKIPTLLDQMSSYIRTDLDAGTISKILGEAPHSKQYKISNFVPDITNYLESSTSSYGGYILVPEGGEDKWEPVQNEISNIIKGITPTPTPAPTVASGSAVKSEK